jgi:hypothetical protein
MRAPNRRPVLAMTARLAAVIGSLALSPVPAAPAAEPEAKPEAAAPAKAGGKFSWNEETRRLDVDIENWPLRRVLEEVATCTGWEIECPDTVNRTVTAKFKNLPASDAMSRLLGDLSYTTLPTASGSRLRILDPTAPTASTTTYRTIARPPTVAPTTPRPSVPTSGFGQRPPTGQRPGTPGQSGDTIGVDLDGDGRVSDTERRMIQRALIDSGVAPPGSSTGPSRDGSRGSSPSSRGPGGRSFGPGGSKKTSGGSRTP